MAEAVDVDRNHIAAPVFWKDKDNVGELRPGGIVEDLSVGFAPEQEDLAARVAALEAQLAAKGKARRAAPKPAKPKGAPKDAPGDG